MFFSKTKGIVFDLDGTLINSPIDFLGMKHSIIELLEENGVEHGTLSKFDTNILILEKTEKAWNTQKKSEIEREKIRVKIEKIMNSYELEALSSIKEVNGVKESVRRLAEEGYKLAVLTRSHHAYAVEALKKINIYDYFNVILGREETPRPKPYADALKHAAKLLCLSMDEIVYIGDNYIDFNSAINAGCRFIGVRSGPFGDKSWGQKKPDVLIKSVKDLPGFLSTN